MALLGPREMSDLSPQSGQKRKLIWSLSAKLRDDPQMWETRRPAAPAVARAPPAATPPPRRRAWLRIFVVGCSLPCDPPVGGHSCNADMIPHFHRLVCDLYGAIRVKAGVNFHLLV